MTPIGIAVLAFIALTLAIGIRTYVKIKGRAKPLQFPIVGTIEN